MVTESIELSESVVRAKREQVQANDILCGDCLELLPKLPPSSVNFALTDPPYLVRYKSRDGRTIQNDDNDSWLIPAFREIHRVLERNSYCVSFYGWPHADKFMHAFRRAGFNIVGHLVFPKPYTSSTSHLKYQHECAFLLAKGYPQKPQAPIGDVIPWAYSGNKLHPTQKPLAALKPLIQAFSARSGLVLDPFAGSGSTLIAAMRLGRPFLGIEIDPTYHAAAAGRITSEKSASQTLKAAA